MILFRNFSTFIVAISLSIPCFASDEFGCAQLLAAKAYINANKDDERARLQLASQTQADLERNGLVRNTAVAVAVIVGMVAGDYALANYVAANVDGQLKVFADMIIAAGNWQIFKSVTGPVLRPLGVKIDRTMFRLGHSEVIRDESLVANLRRMWKDTNINYDENVQNSISLVNAFISRPNWHDAYAQYKEGDFLAAANRLATIVVYMRTHYRSIYRLDGAVASHARGAFTDNILPHIPQDFRELVFERVAVYAAMDHADTPEDHEFYRTVINHWFIRSVKP